MKRTILTVLLVLSCIAASATRQVNDKVIIDGEKWEMPASPLLSLDSKEYQAFKELLGERDFVSSANIRGYVATWHATKKGLYLDKVEALQSNGQMQEVDMDKLMKVLKKHKHKGMIRAEWISGLVKINKGDDNWTLQLKKGRIKNL